MKGFNLAPPTTPATTLPPVAEFIATFQHGGSGNGSSAGNHGNGSGNHGGSGDNPDPYGSSFSGILGSGITPRRNHMYSMHSSSQSSFSESLGNFGKFGKLSSKLRHSNNTSEKRRWGRFEFSFSSFFVLFLFSNFESKIMNRQECELTFVSFSRNTYRCCTIRYW